MKTLYSISLLILCFIFNSITCFASLEPIQESSLYAHMSEVNAKWKHLNESDYKSLAHFDSEEERIQKHLELVIRFLNENEPLGLTETELGKRRNLLNELSAYAEEQVFPMNIYHSERTPYFIDHRGVHCAVGYLILKSGHGDLAQRISSEHNYDYIRDIKVEGLEDWTKEFGFEVDELKWIQPGYPPAQQMSPVGGGTNGPVTVMTDANNDNLVFAGEFDELDGLPCDNIGSWNGEQLTCLGGGVNGQINDLSVSPYNPYIAGSFNYDGAQYPLAQYDGEEWNYFSIPERPDAEATAVLSVGAFSIQAEVILKIADNESELWHLTTENTWIFISSFNGVVDVIKASGLGRVYGGKFSEVTVNGETINAENVIIKNNWDDNWYSLEGEICNHVYALESIGESLYIGGEGSEGNPESVVMSRYLNGTLQTLMTGDNTIYDIKYDNDSRLLLAGDLVSTDIGITLGNHLLEFSIASNWSTPMAVLDEPAKCIGALAGEYYIGGEFTNDQGFELNHLAKGNSVSNSILENDLLDLKVYPNPAQSTVHLDLNGTKTNEVYLLNQTGQIVKMFDVFMGSSHTQLDVTDLARGMYYLRVNQGEMVSITKVVLE